MSSSDTETALSHADTLRRIQEEFFNSGSSLTEAVLERNYAEYVSDLLRWGAREANADLVRAARVFVDHHEARLRAELAGDAPRDLNMSRVSLFEQALELGKLIEQLRDTYAGVADHDDPALLDEAVAYSDHADRYETEVLTEVEKRVEELFAKAAPEEKVAWYVGKYRSFG